MEEQAHNIAEDHRPQVQIWPTTQQLQHTGDRLEHTSKICSSQDPLADPAHSQHHCAPRGYRYSSTGLLLQLGNPQVGLAPEATHSSWHSAGSTPSPPVARVQKQPGLAHTSEEETPWYGEPVCYIQYTRSPESSSPSPTSPAQMQGTVKDQASVVGSNQSPASSAGKKNAMGVVASPEQQATKRSRPSSLHLMDEQDSDSEPGGQKPGPPHSESQPISVQESDSDLEGKFSPAVTGTPAVAAPKAMPVTRSTISPSCVQDQPGPEHTPQQPSQPTSTTAWPPKHTVPHSSTTTRSKAWSCNLMQHAKGKQQPAAPHHTPYSR